MPLIRIDDPHAPGLLPYTSLTEGSLRAEGVFIAESVPVIEGALDEGYEPVSFLAEERHITGKAAPLLRRLGDIPVYTADRETLRSVTGYALTRGVLCAMKRRPLPAAAAILARASSAVFLEDLTDSTNVGALIRSAAAMGAGAILLTEKTCDPFCRRSVRVSMGAVFRVPVAVVKDGPEAVRLLRGHGFLTFAAALREDGVSPASLCLAMTDKPAILIGTEETGLTDEVICLSDRVVTIPMSHGVDSLNAAAAGAVLFWELIGRK